MAGLPILSRDGKEVGTYEISPEDLAPRISRQLLHDAVVMYQANLRLGTHRTRSRSDVSGARKKMYRQKGTGNARAGHKRSPVRRGGGHAFAKRPRDYSYRLPRKALQAATRMAVASKLADNQLMVIDDLSMSQPKTKEMATVLKALGLTGVTTVISPAELDLNLYKSARNIPGVTVVPAGDLNALAVLKPSRMLVTKAALDQLKAKAASSRSTSPAE
ncbi:MAG: 50S ribosomal protein L4 [Planctomycetales bacterium]|nr:50S ribosomal protein L4 [Planctomycetales bacterium]